MTFPRFTSPSLKHRLFDPMPLPKKSSAVRRARIKIIKLNGKTERTHRDLKKFKYEVKKIPLNS